MATTIDINNDKYVTYYEYKQLEDKYKLAEEDASKLANLLVEKEKKSNFDALAQFVDKSDEISKLTDTIKELKMQMRDLEDANYDLRTTVRTLCEMIANG